MVSQVPISGLPSLLGSGFDRFLRAKRSQQLFLIHIGKCGGSSLRRAVAQSRVVKNKFTGVRRFHFEEPFFSESARYLFAVRNPISRVVSAFNYRHQSLLRGGEEKIVGERQVFLKYKSLTELAEDLYVGELPNLEAIENLNSIHHIGDESMSFYLNPLLPSLEPQSVFGVIAIESFAEDVRRILAVSPPHRRKTAPGAAESSLTLSPLAKSNLRRALSDDFEALAKLVQLEPRVRFREDLLAF